MGRRGPEAKIQDKVLKYAKAQGLLYRKNEVGRFFVSAGWPDVVFYPIKPKMPFFIEFKKPGQDLTPLQKYMRMELETRGYKYYMVDTVARGCMIIDSELG